MNFLSLLIDPQVWIAFFTLTTLELVLGIDNIIFISILVDRLPVRSREKARKIGLFFAMFMRIGLLLLLSWIVGATEPLFSVLGKSVSPRDLILIGGGVFLLWKSTQEIHQLLEGEEEGHVSAVKASFSAIILQIIVIDMVFSLDSIITAVGMVDNVPGDDCGGCRICRTDDGFCKRHWQFCFGSPDHQNAGTVIFAGGGFGAFRRGLWDTMCRRAIFTLPWRFRWAWRCLICVCGKNTLNPCVFTKL